MAEINPRQKLIKELRLRLGGGIVRNELDPDHYDFAIDVALQRYRQRSTNALEESFIFLDVQPDVNIYTLPDEVIEVKSIYRRGLGATNGTGASFDPFSQGIINSMYSLQTGSGMGGFSLATYDFAKQQQSLISRLTGQDMQFHYDSSSKRLRIDRKFVGVETISLHAYNEKPETILFKDNYARSWIRDYAVAQCKLIMSEGRSKFATIAGPGGGLSLNGESLKTEANTEITRLDLELTNFVDQAQGFGFVIG